MQFTIGSSLQREFLNVQLLNLFHCIVSKTSPATVADLSVLCKRVENASTDLIFC